MDKLIHTLLHLVVQGVLATATILKGLVYPLWNHALASGTEGCEVYLRAARDIFARLVLSGEEDWGNDTVELQRVRVRRQDVLCAPRTTSFPSRRRRSHARVPRTRTACPCRAALRDAVQSSSFRGCIGISTSCAMPSTSLCNMARWTKALWSP